MDYSFAKGDTTSKYAALDNIKSKLNKEIDSITYMEFSNMLNELHKEIENILRKAAIDENSLKIDYVAVEHVMSCWMIDRNRAIFGYIRNAESSEVGFTTHDPLMIKYIVQISDSTHIAHVKNDYQGEYIDYNDTNIYRIVISKTKPFKIDSTIFSLLEKGK
jgi:hypothetical protein